MHAIAAPPTIGPADRLGFTLFVAIIAHAIAVLGVTFVPHERSHEQTSTLDIVLVQHRSEEEPEEAEFLAQANQAGGGESEEPERPSTPLKTPFAGPVPDIALASPPTPPREQREGEQAAPASPERAPPAAPAERAAARTVIAQAQLESEHRVVDEPAPDQAVEPEPEPRPRPPETPTAERSAAAEPVRDAPARSAAQPPPQPTQTISAATLIQRSLAMASLSAQIDRRLRAYAERPRHKWVTARTKEHKFAAYMEAWRQKVERIGNLNYPDEARRSRLSGNLLLDVALNPDGSINEITLRRSSGMRVLDDAAIRIVKLAAPFAKFPRDIAEEVDILHIERTWQFLSGNRFASR